MSHPEGAEAWKHNWCNAACRWRRRYQQSFEVDILSLSLNSHNDSVFQPKYIDTRMHWVFLLYLIIVCRYFSYEHFYVIYCKFWELDTDHDFFIDKENLIRYGNHALTYRIVDRIFSQVCVDYLLLLSLRFKCLWLQQQTLYPFSF